MSDTPGVKLTSVTISAASPDVIGSLMKEITDRVIASIPPDTLSGIAADALRSGVVLVKRNSCGSNTQESFVLSDEARSVTVKTLIPLVEKAVREHLEKEQTKAVIAQLVEIGVADGLRQSPAMAAQIVAKRMAGAYVGESDDAYKVSQAQMDHDRVNRLVMTLFDRGVIPTPI